MRTNIPAFRLPVAVLDEEIDAILDIPIVLPPLVVGLSLLILFQFPPFSWFARQSPVFFQTPENEELLREMRRRADAAGWLRLALPAEFGGHDASNLKMAIIREHLAHKGLGLHNDLQNEHSIVGNNVGLLGQLFWHADRSSALLHAVMLSRRHS